MKEELVKAPIIPILATIVFIILVGLFIKKGSVIPTFQPTSSPVSTQFATIKDKKISVTALKDDKEREKGLSGVTSLDKDSGVLFVFDNPTKAQTFWMKGMLIPIDIIWIKDEKIVKIDKDVPVPDPETPDEKLQRYSAGIPVDFVLEVNGGFSNTNSFKVGDSFTFSGI